MAQALKRLLIAKMRAKKLEDPTYAVLFVLVDKTTLRIRVDKTYYTIEEASIRFGISVDEILSEKARYHALVTTNSEKRKSNKRKGDMNEVSANKAPKL
ncbi:hypothetical protein Y032_0038g3631 [Ancylostoma ceylanicum]|uniref:Uncharacterized protein n=1 Tax=Ancylostoma ceylanicum TaxID=53326 RepID=A0A016UJM7_9BILA|nr:hypothetical protein Y032_0038g3631 [Ancylostoma ceylanicum]